MVTAQAFQRGCIDAGLHLSLTEQDPAPVESQSQDAQQGDQREQEQQKRLPAAPPRSQPGRWMLELFGMVNDLTGSFQATYLTEARYGRMIRVAMETHY